MAVWSTLLCTSLVLALLGGDLEATIDPTTKAQINSGLNMGEEIADGLTKFGHKETNKLFDRLDKMAGFLGAAGGLVSFALIFVPKQDFAELRYMKEQFSNVNMKLDNITDELDNIQDLITLENQRSEYTSAAASILFGFDQLNLFLAEIASVACSAEKECLRERLKIAESYVDRLNVKQQMHAILYGSVKPMSAFGKPLLDLIKITYKCDVGKLDRFANGVLKLSFKAQQVILTHEKLTGTSSSILVSMKSWLEMVFDLRRELNQVRNDCFNDITSYMIRDIQQAKYQSDYDNNQGAADAVKRDMSSKYPWVHWLVYAYAAYGDDNHWVGNQDGTFWNIPDNKDDRKRNIIVAPQDKGEYFGQRGHFAKEFEAVIEKVSTVDSAADQLYNIFKKELEKREAWRLSKSFVVLRSYDNLKFAVDTNHELFWYNEEVSVSLRGNSNTDSMRVRVIAILKSRDEIDKLECKKTCNGHGVCRMLPYSTRTYCQCEDYYQGENCNYHLRTKLAFDMEKMLATTFTIPKLTDVYFEIKDLGLYLGSSINKELDAAFELGNQVKKSYDKLNEKLTDEFRWSNLITVYSDTITGLTYSVNNVPDLASYEQQGCIGTVVTNLAEKVLLWLHDINYMIIGRADVLIKHKSIMLMMIDTHKDKACSSEYKDAIDNTWRQLILLQHQASMLLAQLRDVMGQSSTEVLESYQSTINKQKQFLDSQTCQLDIPYSTNVHCRGGFYLYPGLNIENKCQLNYFVSGSLNGSCLENQSTCRSCSCHSAGSVGNECRNLNGQCTCKNQYYGTRCESRHCQYDSWQSWANCPACGAGSETRRRSIVVTREGSGNNCWGPGSETQPCFRGCCTGEFQCGSRSCLANSKRCNYWNDCGGFDENNCDDNCRYYYTHYQYHGSGNMVYVDRHKVNCGSKPRILQMFSMETVGDNIRYKYKCCTLLKDICSYSDPTTTQFSSDGGGNMVYLDRHRVDCGEHGFINDFWLERNSEHTQVRYQWYCCNLLSRYHSKISCFSDQTSFTDDGGGEVYYLARQSVSCPDKYYLNSFRLQRDDDHDYVRYDYRCCTISL